MKSYPRAATGVLMMVVVNGIAVAGDISAPASVQSAEASIPFGNRGGVRDWQAVDESTLLLQDRHGRWYRATLQSPARDLLFAENLSFVTTPSGTIDRFSSVSVKGRRYPIISLTRTDPPPPVASRQRPSARTD